MSLHVLLSVFNVCFRVRFGDGDWMSLFSTSYLPSNLACEIQPKRSLSTT